MSDTYIIEVGSQPAGIIVRAPGGYRFFVASHRFTRQRRSPGWSELGGRPGQQLPVAALLLPIHQDVQVLRRLLAVGELLFADESEAHDRVRSDDLDRGILVFERRPLVVRLGDAIEQ